MENVSQEELIGWYFDGVATAEEQHQAERLLQQNPAARVWLAQLEELRSALASLPRHKMPADCTSQVLERAEQLRRSRLPRTILPVRQAQDSSRRAWVAFAVAAAALIVVVLPNIFARLNPLGVARREPGQTVEDPHVEAQPGEVPESHFADDVDRLSKTPSMGKAAKRVDPSRGGDTELFGNNPVSGLSEESTRLGAVSNSPPTEGAVLADGVSFVYNVATPEAQRAVLETFEKTLREQQIVLETDAPQSGQLAPSPVLAEGGLGGRAFGGGAGGGGFAPGQSANPAKPQIDRRSDCVYVLEATPLQLANTIQTLDNLAVAPVPPIPADRARRMARSDEVQLLTQQPEDKSGLERAKAPSGQPQPTNPSDPARGYAAPSQQLYRSQAVWLSAEFDPATNYESTRSVLPSLAAPAASPTPQTASAPAPPPAARPNAKDSPAPVATRSTATQPAEPSPAPPAAAGTVVRDRWGFTQRSGKADDEQRESLQRAVIIFRVVPGEAKPE